MKESLLKNYGYYQSPIGLIEIVADEKIISLTFVTKENCPNWKKDNVIINNCIAQLEQYFQQKLDNFNLPLAIKGTFFQELVWSETYKIPYGTQITYQQLAKQINKNGASRAVGSALAKNPLAIIIPCHRVVNANNKIVNYFWGKERKIFLQKLEQKRH